MLQAGSNSANGGSDAFGTYGAATTAPYRGFSPGWMERHEEPVVNARYPELLDNAVQDMLEDVRSRVRRTIVPRRR